MRLQKRNWKRIFGICMALVLIFCVPVSVNAEEMDVDARCVLLIDAQTGTILYEKNANVVCYPASTTKIMTALLAIEAIESGTLGLYDQVPASRTAAEGIPSDASHLKERIQVGEVLSIEDYLYAALMQSDTYSCNMLAECVDGTIEAFVEHMNQRAAELGCKNTHFANTTGYPDTSHYSNAYSLYLIAKAAMEHPLFAQIVGTADHMIPATEQTMERQIHNTNWLLGMPLPDENGNSVVDKYSADYYYPYCQGIKTGTTSAAGNCLVSCALKDGQMLFCVILGAKNVKQEDKKTDRQSFSETIRMYEWGFENFESRQLLTAGERIGSFVCHTKGGEKEITFYAQEDLITLLPKEISESSITYKISLDRRTLYHPQILYDRAPKVQIYGDGELIAEQELTFTGVNKRYGLNLFLQAPQSSQIGENHNAVD